MIGAGVIPRCLVDPLQEGEDALLELFRSLLVVVGEATVGEQVSIARVQT
jgi:hypothetical protein